MSGERLISVQFVQFGRCRVDLPGSDPAEMYETLTQRLAKLPDDTVLYPGHDYGHSPTSTMGAERRENTYMRVPSLDAWLGMMGRPRGF